MHSVNINYQCITKYYLTLVTVKHIGISQYSYDSEYVNEGPSGVAGGDNMLWLLLSS